MPEIYHVLLDAICGSQSEHLFKNAMMSKRLSKIKTEQKKASERNARKPYFSMAERVGFEPTVAHHHT